MTRTRWEGDYEQDDDEREVHPNDPHVRHYSGAGSSVPIVFGMHYPGIIVVMGRAYNDMSVAPPCYRLSDDPRVGFQTARWIESEPPSSEGEA